jgi:neopullulanase
MKNITIIFTLFLFGATAFAKEFEIKHVEPLHWWVGMHRPELQIMVHGDNISALTPQIDYPGVTLVSVDKTDNKNYLFINLSISEVAKPGRINIELIGGDKTLAQVNYRLESRDANSTQRLGFSAKDAIYLLMPDRFASGASANDTHKNLLESVNRKISGGRHGGDIKGMHNHLDYISDMGFTMIWPTPLIENNQEKYSYHGYSATDHYKIDARFGTNDDYKKFVAAANKKGVGVIQDIVLNHIGSGHWWMNDMPAKDWINFSKNFVQTTHKRTTLHDIHAAPEDTTLFSDGWFVDTMPDLNQRNALLATYLIQNSIWWIEYANLSGIREDTYSYSDKNFLAVWTKAILDEYPRFNIVGEEWTNNAAIVASWQKGKLNANGYTSHLPSLMDFPVHDAVRAALTEDEGDAKGFIKIYETLANDFLYADPMNMVVFAENHDTSRIFSVLDESTDLLKTALLFTATTRGIPQFFYGTEVLLTSPKERDDGAVRADMLGGWQGDRTNAFTGKNLTKAQIDVQSYLKNLLNWRKTNAAIQEGKLIHYVPESSTYVYFRITATQKVMVVLNKNKKPVSLNLSRFESTLKGAQQGRDALMNSKIDLTQPLYLKPMTSMLIEF